MSHAVGRYQFHDKPADYARLAQELGALLAGESDPIANAANTAALVFEALPEVNWAGFYFLKGGQLVVGPFQGRPACVRIALGSGVCGTAAVQRRTLVVPDVLEFPGHIACDPASRSEIVVPLIGGDPHQPGAPGAPHAHGAPRQLQLAGVRLGRDAPAHRRDQPRLLHQSAGERGARGGGAARAAEPHAVARGGARRDRRRLSHRARRASAVDRLFPRAHLLALRTAAQGDQRRGAPGTCERDAAAAAARGGLSRVVSGRGHRRAGLLRRRHRCAPRRQRAGDGDSAPAVRLRGAPPSLLDGGRAAVHRADSPAALRRRGLSRALRARPRSRLCADLGGARDLRGRWPVAGAERAAAAARLKSAAPEPFRARARRRAYPLLREMYSPVRVSMRITSPSLMKSGTRTTAPVSSLAGFWPPVAVSPRSPGSVSMTLSSMCGGGVTTSGTLFQDRKSV